MAQVVINIEDDEKFQKIIKEGIAALQPEDLKEVLIGAIREILTKNNGQILKDLLIRDEGTYSRRYVPTQLAMKCFDQCDFTGLQDVADKMTAILNDNYKNILENLLFKLIIEGAFSRSGFYDTFARETSNQIIKRENQIREDLSNRGITF